MKKIIKAITLFLIIAIFSEVSYAAEYLNSVEFNRKHNMEWQRMDYGYIPTENITRRY